MFALYPIRAVSALQDRLVFLGCYSNPHASLLNRRGTCAPLQYPLTVEGKVSDLRQQTDAAAVVVAAAAAAKSHVL